MERVRPRSRGAITALSAFAMVLLLAACNQAQSPSKNVATPESKQRAPGTSPSSPAATPSANGAKAENKRDSHGEQREAVFEGWPKPQFALVMTGQQIGYLEPCGCTGLANQKGGLARRHTLIRQLKEDGWPIVAVDVGNQIRRFGRQSEIQFQNTVDALKKMGYQAIAPGVDDLRLSAGALAATTFAGDDSPTPFASANAAVYQRELTPTHHVVESAGKKIGITSILGSNLQSKIVSSEILLTPPQAGLDSVLPKLREAKCDLLVLLAHASLDESRQLAQKYPDFHIIVTAGDGGDASYQPEPIPDSKAIMVQVGLKGMYAGVLAFYNDPKTPWRYQRVPLDSRFSDSPEMLAILASYQKELETAGFDGLALSPLPHPSGRAFVGSEKCGECHTKAYATWKDTPHFHATESLVKPPERSEIPRHFDPECLSCHVTGWDPQKMFPYVGGYLSLDKTPRMTGSGCENCHGPGAAHVAAQTGEQQVSEEVRAQLQAGMRLRLSEAEKKCVECHDMDNSPEFHKPDAFKKYWEQVEHKGLD